jgi:3-(3-hydroxy-phenyl)propionate hydroxylase
MHAQVIPSDERLTLDRVLVCGAGPVGLATALGLARAKVPVTVMDDGRAHEPRTVALQPATTELLGTLDYAQHVSVRGERISRIGLRTLDMGAVALIDLGVLATESTYPFLLSIDQAELCRILKAELSSGRHDVEFWSGSALAVRTQDDDSVTVCARSANRSLTDIEVPWAIGADGPASAIRASLPVDMRRMSPSRTILGAIIEEPPGTMPADLEMMTFLGGTDAWLSLIYGENGWSVVRSAPTTPDDPRPGGRPAAGLAALQNDLQQLTGRDTPLQLRVVHESRNAHRVASQFRFRRVLLAGDAAHLSHPIGGKGINGGLQDAVSLSRRLSWVWHGRRPDAVLDEYSYLRNNMARYHLENDIHAAFAPLTEPDPELRQLLIAAVQIATQNPIEHREFAHRMSMLSTLRSHL